MKVTTVKKKTDKAIIKTVAKPAPTHTIRVVNVVNSKTKLPTNIIARPNSTFLETEGDIYRFFTLDGRRIVETLTKEEYKALKTA